MSVRRKDSRRVSRRLTAGRFAMILFALLVAARLGARIFSDSPEVEPSLLHEGPWLLERVVDGDTIIIRSSQSDAGRKIRVRLLGVDTPETVKPNHPVESWGPEATRFTKQFLRERKLSIRLDRRRVDQFGRSLAYVYVDDLMLNEELVRTGLARVSVFPGDSASLARLFRQAEQEARSERRGIWSRRALKP